MQQDRYILLCNPNEKKETLSARYPLRAFYLNHIPRMLGFACFFIIAFAILRLAFPGSFIARYMLAPAGILMLLLAGMGWVNRRTDAFAKAQQYGKR